MSLSGDRSRSVQLNRARSRSMRREHRRDELATLGPGLRLRMRRADTRVIRRLLSTTKA